MSNKVIKSKKTTTLVEISDYTKKWDNCPKCNTYEMVTLYIDGTTRKCFTCKNIWHYCTDAVIKEGYFRECSEGHHNHTHC